MAPLSKDLVDDLDVRAAIRELYGLRDSDMELPGISERVADLDLRVEQARREGRLTRYARKDPVSGFVAGYCYKRVELYEFLRTQPGFRRRSAQKAQQDGSRAS